MGAVAFGGYPTVDVDGSVIEYRRVDGDPARPTIVLLHEGLGCVALWRDFPERIAAATTCPVFTYSRPGYGGSTPISLPRPLDYMSREAADGLPRTLRAAGIDDFILVGHSDGASIALVHAGSAPSGLVSVVVMAPHIFAEQVSIDSIRAADDAYRHGELRRRLAKYHGPNVDNAFRGWCDSWLHPDFRAWSIERELDGIVAPVLQIQGRGDEYGTGEQLRRIEQAVSGPVETLLFDRCGHAPQQDQPELTLEAIGRFCR